MEKCSRGARPVAARVAGANGSGGRVNATDRSDRETR